MGSNTLRPEEWIELVAAIRSGDPNVAQRLADRERRFDNYFSTLTYIPVLRQGGTSITCTVDYCNVTRLGVDVWVTAQVTATHVGPGNNDISLSLPPQIPAPVYAAGLSIAGVFAVRIAATSVVRTGSAWCNVDRVSGYIDSANALAGTNPAITLAVGDSVSMAIHFTTAQNPLV